MCSVPGGLARFCNIPVFSFMIAHEKPWKNNYQLIQSRLAGLSEISPEYKEMASEQREEYLEYWGTLREHALADLGLGKVD